ncbi:MAG: DUF2934 domain-containing protein [Sulfuritalea sp.]|nr:DUF2934 domain-containing protein [Sulfuritalea sp.]
MASPKSSTKTSAKTAPAKPATPAKLAAKAKVKAPAKTAGKVEPAAKQAPARTAAGKAAPKKAAAPKPARSPAKRPKSVPQEQRRNYIEMAAYYIAERRGFTPGNPLEDWMQAEAEIDRLLAEGRLGG